MFNSLYTFLLNLWKDRLGDTSDSFPWDTGAPQTADEFPPHEGQSALFWTCPICGLQMTDGFFDRHLNAHAVTTFEGFVETLDISLDDTQPIFARTPDGK